ncbi:MAG: 3-oxoacid CoA-transferase [Desulfobacteraceae bacterium]|jgi:glutaconate CoA-transferase subunit B|nr:MAG: 3-oxoacid CoA-transferase [Desulfobacteraceae bacterium]
MTEYSAIEMMICVAARELENGSTVGVGTGAPCAAAMLAQKTTAKDLSILFEAGGISPQLPEMPISVGDSRTFYKAAMAGSMGDTMEACSRGFVDYTFLGGAQIDKYGNLNSTIIGKEHRHPKVRLPGSGGANDFASFCWRTMIMTVQDKRRFVEKLDFMTTPGWINGDDSREKSGLPLNTGPYKIITNLALMDFEPKSKRMRVISIHPGYTFNDVQDNCGFELLCAETAEKTHPPSMGELKILREEVDPYRYVIGR